MRRRAIFGLLGSAAITRPSDSRAQAKPPHLGVLLLDSPDTFMDLLKPALREFGYIDRQNIRIDIRSGDGKGNALPTLASELVGRKVDLIVAHLTPAVVAARQASRDMPIVMAGAGDPVGAGLVASLARPGGNVTGVAGAAAQLAGKLVELVRDMMPAAQRIGVLANITDPFTTPFLNEIQTMGQAVGIEPRVVMVGHPGALEPAFVAMDNERPDALIVQPTLPRRMAAGLAARRRWPALSLVAAFAREGGLVAYASNQAELHRQTAFYVDKVLKGSKPADLPVTQSTRFDLVVNLRTARSIGFTIPPAILARADEVIE